MYFAVKLVSSEQKIVPLKWIQNLDMAQVWNYGLNSIKKIKFKVFVSENFSAEPNFQLNEQDQYDKKKPACYMAKIACCFGKCS